jgi:transcriptional regulator with XRE-family HTH domain
MANCVIGRQIKRALKQNLTTVIEIAAYTGASRSTVYNWIAGRRVSPAYQNKALKFIARLLKESK